jgi:hypothetical protein
MPRLQSSRAGPRLDEIPVTPSSTEHLPGGTPILDRESPLPGPASGSGTPVVVGIVLCLAALAALIAWHPPFIDSLRDWIRVQVESLFPGPWTPSRAAAVCVFSLLIGFAITAIHELGHLIVGVCVGFRCHSLFLGPLQFNAPFRIAPNPDPRSWWHGGVTLVPVEPERLRGGAVAMLFAGPAANLLTGVAVLLLPYPKGYFSWLFIAASLLAGVVELFLPVRGPTFVFDGRRIWMLLRDRARGERWLALMKLIADAREGVAPESMSASLQSRATAIRDDSADTVLAHAFAYSAAFHQDRDGEAGQMLEVCLRHAGHATPATREALVSDAAVYQARRRKRPDLAGQWLTEIPEGTPRGWLRSRAEAAILEASGDTDAALGKLADVEAALSLPGTPRRETLLQLLERWKTDLRDS